MKKTFEAFPEFLGIDTNYKLMNIAISIFVLTTEDGNCKTEILAICLLVSEDYESMEWFINTFKEKNLNWKSLKCIVVDKDLVEKELVEESFPEAKVSTSAFHSIKTFSRELKSDMYGINDEKRDQILSVFQKMTEASSESTFEALYDDLKAFAPQNVLIYFYKNWYHIRKEWSMCEDSFKYNFINTSECRIDSVNAKLKKATNRKSNLEDFLDILISTFNFLDCKRDYKASLRQQKRLVTKYDSSSPEKKYMDHLTCEAAKFVISHLENSRKISSDQFVKKDEEFVFRNPEGKVIANSTANCCNCSFKSAMLLPCQHMFLIRRIFDMPLFVPDLVPRRWTIAYYTRNQLILQQCIDQEVSFVESEDKKVQESGCKLSFGGKRRKVLLQMQELADIAAQADDVIFQERMQDIKDLLTFWKNGFKTQVVMLNEDEPNLQSSQLEAHTNIKEENLDEEYTEDLNEELNSEIKNEEVYLVVMERSENSRASEKDVTSPLLKRGRPKKPDSLTNGVKKSKRFIKDD